MILEENKLLAPLTTFGIGGPARWFVEATSEDEVVEATSWARERGLPLFVLGGGSNLLVADRGFDGLVLKVGLKGIAATKAGDGSGHMIYEVGAGADWDGFEALTREHPGLLLIEDAAQAFGAAWNNRPAGSLGHAAAFSFYPTKNLAAFGDAGLVTTSDSALATSLRSLLMPYR